MLVKVSGIKYRCTVPGPMSAEYGSKRRALIIAISTAGEPFSEFEEKRTEMRQLADAFDVVCGAYFLEGDMLHLRDRASADQDREETRKLSRAGIETLAIIAYKQPVTRGAIEDVRGVQCGPVLRQLMDLKLVQVTGRDEQALGRPLLYGTTEQFLSRFGLARAVLGVEKDVALLEGHAAELFAKRATPEQLAAMKDALAGFNVHGRKVAVTGLQIGLGRTFAGDHEADPVMALQLAGGGGLVVTDAVIDYLVVGPDIEHQTQGPKLRQVGDFAAVQPFRPDVRMLDA